MLKYEVGSRSRVIPPWGWLGFQGNRDVCVLVFNPIAKDIINWFSILNSLDHSEVKKEVGILALTSTRLFDTRWGFRMIGRLGRRSLGNTGFVQIERRVLRTKHHREILQIFLSQACFVIPIFVLLGVSVRAWLGSSIVRPAVCSLWGRVVVLDCSLLFRYQRNAVVSRDTSLQDGMLRSATKIRRIHRTAHCHELFIP